MVSLETERLILRPFTEADAADLYEYAKDPRVGPAAGWQPHRDEAESLRVIREIFQPSSSLAVVLKQTGRVIGSAGYVDRHREELPGPDDEIGYSLSPDYWGQGLIPEAVEEILRYGFEELGLNAQWCAHYAGNEKSRRVIEKCGFRYHFTHRAWVEAMEEERDELYYALTREEWERR